MTTLLVHHKVEDYSKWRAVFDEMDGVRRSMGQTAVQVLRAAADPNEIVILTTWPTVEHARAYGQLPDLKAAMEKGGVISQPEILILEEAKSLESVR
jgi:heme-degrading monooxygenase HmoA